MKYQFKYIISLLMISIISCKKMIDIDPPKTQLTPEKAFADDQTALAVLSNIYAQFNSLIDNNLTPPIAIYTDELSTTSSSAGLQEYYNGTVSTTNTSNLNIWKGFYSAIYQCNALLENIAVSTNVTMATKQQLKGEALFLRSFSYFYLINIYGDVPLLLNTQVSITSTAHRNSIAEVYNQIISDLTDAENNLPESYPSSDKVRANKWTTVALLARVYLYQQNWTAAETNANSVISSGLYSPLDNPAAVFLKNSKEAILQFWTQNGFITEGPLFVPSIGSAPAYPLTSGLLASFETGDLRKSAWTNSVTIASQTYSYPLKYKNRTTTSGANAEYLMSLRLSEQYLIRAEARAKQNNVTGSQSDLNVIRNRAGLTNTSANTQTTLLMAIDKENRIEFFAEWGHRFFDLKRTNQLNSIIGPLKPNWRPTSALFPIPQSELLNNPNLTQNPGY